MEAKRFKVGLAVLAMVVLALFGCAGKTDVGLANAVGTSGAPGEGGVLGAAGDVGAGGEPGIGGALGEGGVPGTGGTPGGGEPGTGGDVGGGGEPGGSGAGTGGLLPSAGGAPGGGGVPGAGGTPGGGGVPGAGGAQCGGGVPNAGGAATEADFDAEEQVVYAALLAQQYPASLYVLQTETGVDATWGTNPPLGGLDALDAVLASMITDHSVSGETTASFAARNATAYPVATDMNIGAPYVLITDQEIAQLRASFSIGAQLYAQLREWQARYPGADCIMQLSRVGFNSSLDQALVYAATDYGVGWAEGDFYVLQKCSSGWLVTYKERNWYS